MGTRRSAAHKLKREEDEGEQLNDDASRDASPEVTSSKPGATATWSNQNEAVADGIIGGFIRRTFLAAATMIYGQVVLILWYVAKHRNGSFTEFWEKEASHDLWQATLQGFMKPQDVSTTAWQFIGVFFVVAIALMQGLPGDTHSGPVTPNGHVPKYKINGVKSFLVHIFLFFCGK